MGGACSTHGEMTNTSFWLVNLKGRSHLKDLGVDGKIILDWILGNVWSVCIWISTGTSYGLL
jgi:hypothetical protein